MAALTSVNTESLNFTRLQEFPGRLMRDFGAAMTVLACGVGDRLGLFAALACEPLQTAAGLSAKTGFDPILIQAWLQIMAAAGYVDYLADSKQFSLPVEYELLANLDPNSGLAGGFQLFLGMAKPIESLIAAFVDHRGVAQNVFDRDLRGGMERMSAPWFDTQLVESWIPAIPGLKEKLNRGLRVADIGCGSGRALRRLARCFPLSTFKGFDLFAPVLTEADLMAASEHLSDTLRFAQCDVTKGIPAEFDLITMFNSLHDVTPAVDGLKSIKRALAPEGCCLILESAFSDRLEDNLHPLGAVLYGTGLFYNTPVSIANGGSGPGAAGLTEARVFNLCDEAGLNVRRLSLPNPMHALYLATDNEA